MTEEERPLDLGALAQVQSPDVVHAALRRFRRRVLTRSAWVVVLVVAVALVVGNRVREARSDLAGRIEGAPTVANPAVYQVGGVSVGLEAVTSLGDALGLHFVLIDPRGGLADCFDLSSATPASGETSVGRGSGPISELWVRVPVPPTHRLGFAVRRCGRTTPRSVLGIFTVDLDALGFRGLG